MKYAVVIVTFNRITLLKECLDAVDQQTYPFAKIIIVNNCSTDGTVDFLQEFIEGRNDIIVITTDSNLGGAGGFEIGLRAVSEAIDFVLLIDDDAILDHYFLERIENQREDGILAYSGTVMTAGEIDRSHRRRLTDKVFMKKSDVPFIEYQKESFLYELSTFCGLIISLEIIKKIGYPLGEYFIWYDDTEYSFRIRKYTTIKNVNSARINHKTAFFHDNSLNWKSYYGYRNQIDVGRKYSSVPWIYLFSRYLYHVFRGLQYGVLFLFGKKKQYFKNSMKLNIDVIKDSRKHVLGLSKDYYPGKRFD